MNLLLVKADQIGPDGIFTATAEQSEHIACILHAQKGDRIKAGVFGGKIGLAELVEPSKKQAKLKILSLDREPPQKKNLRFVIALPRPQSFKKCLHFLASAGIPEACFIQTARVEKSYWNSAGMTAEAIEKEIFLGLEQGVDTIPPQLHFFPSFRDWKDSEFCRDFSGRRLIAHPVNAVSCPVSMTDPALVAIGPEGGFIPRELDVFRELGFECVELGAYILRVEFALAYICGRLTP